MSPDRQCLSSKNYFVDTYGEQLWFSYDGSRIFLDTGLTLTSSNDDSDMQPHGDFNSSHGMYEYLYFSQSSKSPYNIVGIRKDLNDTIFYYSWQYLNFVNSEPIPPPPQGRIYGAEEVHVCDRINAIVRLNSSGNSIKIGLVPL